MKFALVHTVDHTLKPAHSLYITSVASTHFSKGLHKTNSTLRKSIHAVGRPKSVDGTRRRLRQTPDINYY